MIKQTICLAGQTAIDNWNRKKYDETRGAAAAGKFCLERGNQGKGAIPASNAARDATHAAQENARKPRAN